LVLIIKFFKIYISRNYTHTHTHARARARARAKTREWKDFKN